MAKSVYETQLQAARLNELRLLDQQLTILDRILRELHDELSAVLEEMSDVTGYVHRARLRDIQTQVARMIDNTIDEIRDAVVEGMTYSVQYAGEGRLYGSLGLFEQYPDVARSVVPIFSEINEDAINALLSRIWDDGKTFSNRIWDLRNYTQQSISEMVAKGVIQGKSAREIARDLEPFLRMTDAEYKAYQRTWAEVHDEAWKADWKTRGRLKYNLQRLARTEINNAFREGAIQSAKRAPWIVGLKWNLSVSHPKEDICDSWASDDPDGLGAGGYLPDNVPLDHPNGLCYVTDILVSEDELAEMIRNGEIG